MTIQVTQVDIDVSKAYRSGPLGKILSSAVTNAVALAMSRTLRQVVHVHTNMIFFANGGTVDTPFVVFKFIQQAMFMFNESMPFSFDIDYVPTTLPIVL